MAVCYQEHPPHLLRDYNGFHLSEPLSKYTV
jgi:hypothetical protein